MPPDIDIRLLDTADPAAVRALYEAANWWEAGDDEGGIVPMIEGSFRFAAAFLNGSLVGMGRVLSDGVSDAYIQDVTVALALRGHGIGADIIRFLVDECRRAGITWIGLVAEPGTAAFYERLGFEALIGHVPMRLKREV